MQRRIFLVAGVKDVAMCVLFAGPHAKVMQAADVANPSRVGPTVAPSEGPLLTLEFGLVLFPVARNMHVSIELIVGHVPHCFPYFPCSIRCTMLMLNHSPTARQVQL